MRESAAGSTLSAAIEMAADKHAGQKRKGTRLPYFVHPVAVAALTASYNGSVEQVSAALLHDTVEDCGGLPVLDEIEARFGHGVARLVADCTVLPEPGQDWHAAKTTIIKKLEGLDAAPLLVAACDKLENALSVYRDLLRVGGTLWSRFTGGEQSARWYFRSLAEVLGRYERLQPGRDLILVVDALEHAADRIEPVPARFPPSSWRRTSTPIKKTLMAELRRLGEAGVCDASIAIAYLAATGHLRAEEGVNPQDWLARAGAENMLEEMIDSTRE